MGGLSFSVLFYICLCLCLCLCECIREITIPLQWGSDKVGGQNIILSNLGVCSLIVSKNYITVLSDQCLAFPYGNLLLV